MQHNSFYKNLIRVEQGTSSNSGSSVKDTRTVSPGSIQSGSIQWEGKIGILLEFSFYGSRNSIETKCDSIRRRQVT